jgi:iron(III) transport system substrate-binding protein
MSKKLQITIFSICLFVLIFPFFVDLIKYTTGVDITKKPEQRLLEDKNKVIVYSSKDPALFKTLFDNFTNITGVKVIVISDTANKLINKIQGEGEKSTADLFITDDAEHLITAKELDILSSTESAILSKNIGAEFIDPEYYWYGISGVARVIIYNKEKTTPQELKSYDNLVNKKWQGKVIISPTNQYNISWLAFIMEKNNWEEEEIARFIRKLSRNLTTHNLAKGAEIKQVEDGYLALINSNDFLKSKFSSKVAVFFPPSGVHFNISGAGISKYAKNKENALKLLEYLSSKASQEYFARVNFEYPLNKQVAFNELGRFKQALIPIDMIREKRDFLRKKTSENGW